MLIVNAAIWNGAVTRPPPGRTSTVLVRAPSLLTAAPIAAKLDVDKSSRKMDKVDREDWRAPLE